MWGPFLSLPDVRPILLCPAAGPLRRRYNRRHVACLASRHPRPRALVLRLRAGARVARVSRARRWSRRPARPASSTLTRTFGVEGHRLRRAPPPRRHRHRAHRLAGREIPDLTMRAARAGKHIVMGKPMAMTVAQADEMVAVVEAAGVVCVPFQGLMRLRQRRSRRGSTPARSATSPCCTRRADGPSPRTGTSRARPAGSSIPRRCPAARSSTRASTGSTCSGGWPAARSSGRREDAQHRPPRHRRRGLGLCDVHVRQRRHRHARGVLDDQRAAQDRAVAQAQQRRPPRDGRARAARLWSSGSDRRAAPCSRPGPRTGCSSGAARRSARRRRSR